ncbi:putative RDD family membrane protein YckC [Streptomyces sp. B3I7]|uniref:RDD family protein n=1 Tax=Streptomyces sp. B3I7 TaxID=3042269 RepID=UPI00277D7DC8|nr:RDD family protein [Streptomyces sp. B3I7]MDQ0813173.1 putative RDD family membrane protein YckC [Streptomyces sp. B3I7]
MSAPTPAPGDDRPREGYYPDPSIPGYVRYWNGATWVPGTSRPAPTDGGPLAPPPGVAPAVPAPTPASVEETGPHFFDEEDAVGGGPAAGPAALSAQPQPASQSQPASQPQPSAQPQLQSADGPADARHGRRPEPASAWGADRTHQSGFGGDRDRQVSWGAPGAADPRVPHASAPPAQPGGRSTRADGTATIPPAEPEPQQGTMVFRRQAGGEGPSAESPGTMRFRPVPPQAGEATGDGPDAGSAAARQALGPDPNAPAGRVPQQGQMAAPTPALPPAPTPAAPAAAVPAQGQNAQSTSQSPQPSQHSSTSPVTTGPGGGQPSWAQQVHQLAGGSGGPAASGGTDGERVTPWKPVVEDPFQALVRDRSQARPAALGRRLLARLLDTVVVGAVTGAAAVPLGTKGLDHVNDKIDAAKQSGETVTVWLLDGTTSVYAGIVLAVLLVFGALYEALPTAKWGRTLGKKLCGLQVRDIEELEPPTFGAALRRWLVYSVLGLLVVGIVGVLWGLFDRPWRQCWHDKAAHTFVAG